MPLPPHAHAMMASLMLSHPDQNKRFSSLAAPLPLTITTFRISGVSWSVFRVAEIIWVVGRDARGGRTEAFIIIPVAGACRNLVYENWWAIKKHLGRNQNTYRMAQVIGLCLSISPYKWASIDWRLKKPRYGRHSDSFGGWRKKADFAFGRHYQNMNLCSVSGGIIVGIA